jgi:hypothetical protein
MDGRIHPAILAAVTVASAGLGFASLSGLGAWLGHGHSGVPRGPEPWGNHCR